MSPEINSFDQSPGLASGCPAENMNPYLEPIYSQLPRCLLSCPDPPMLPEGYKQEITFSGLGVHRDQGWRCNAGFQVDYIRNCLATKNWFLVIEFWLLGIVSPNTLTEGLAKHMPCRNEWTSLNKLDIWDSCSWFSGKNDCTINPLMCSYVLLMTHP